MVARIRLLFEEAESDSVGPLDEGVEALCDLELVVERLVVLEVVGDKANIVAEFGGLSEELLRQFKILFPLCDPVVEVLHIIVLF